MVKQMLGGRGIWSALCPSKGFFTQKNKNLYLSQNWGNRETFLYTEAVMCPTVRMITKCRTHFASILKGHFADLQPPLTHYNISRIIVFFSLSVPLWKVYSLL